MSVNNASHSRSTAADGSPNRSSFYEKKHTDILIMHLPSTSLVAASVMAMASLINPVFSQQGQFNSTKDWCCCPDGCRTRSLFCCKCRYPPGGSSYRNRQSVGADFELIADDLSLLATTIPDTVLFSVRAASSAEPTGCCGTKCGNRLNGRCQG